jgi:predicted MFS family arabinose efflux permease
MVSSPAGFAGSFLLGVLVLAVGLLVVCAFTNNRSLSDAHEVSGRPLLVIMRQPAFLIAAGSAAVGYGVMSLVMTATPISMHHFSDHSVDQTRLVIQSHIVAMFLPSLLSGYLVKRGMRFGLLYCGLALYFLVVCIAQLGVEVVHYWWALVLLGLGWNLLFLTSTALLPTAYRAEERFKTQAANDFLIFTTQAIAAFGAGWLLFHGGWNRIVILSLTVTAVWACTLFVLHRRQALGVHQ